MCAPDPKNGTVTTNSPVTAADTHDTLPGNDPVSGSPPHEEKTRKGRNDQFNINFIQINLNKSKSATGDLAIFTKNKDKPILLVQEPHVNGKNVLSRVSPCLKAIASRNKETRPRACIFHHKSMSKQLWPKDSFTTGDCAVAQTQVDGRDTIIASCYMDRNDELCPPQAFRDIVEHAKTHKLPLITGSDVNAHNTAWKSRVCDKVAKERGDKLLEYILANNLFIENVGDTPTFDNGRWKNIIDLTITNQLGHNLVERWDVKERTHGKNLSDHKYVIIQQQTS